MSYFDSIAGIEFYAKDSGIQVVAENLYRAADIQSFDVPLSPLPALKTNDRLYRKIPQLIQSIQNDYDYIIFPSYVMLANINPHDLNCTVVTYIHDLDDYFHAETKLAWLNAEMAIHNAKNSDIVIANSNTTKTVLENTLFPQKRVNVVRPGTATTEFYPENKRPSVNLPDNYALYVGSFLERKNTKFLLDVLAHLEDDLHLVVAGNYHSEERKEDFLHSAETKGLHNRISVTGLLSMTDLRRTYSLANVYLHPCQSGGYEMTPIEAAACGTPVVMYENIPSAEALEGVAHLFSKFDANLVAEQVENARDASISYEARTWDEAGKELIDNVLQDKKTDQL